MWAGADIVAESDLEAPCAETEPGLRALLGADVEPAG